VNDSLRGYRYNITFIHTVLKLPYLMCYMRQELNNYLVFTVYEAYPVRGYLCTKESGWVGPYTLFVSNSDWCAVRRRPIIYSSFSCGAHAQWPVRSPGWYPDCHGFPFDRNLFPVTGTGNGYSCLRPTFNKTRFWFIGTSARTACQERNEVNKTR